jgi:hypothetical protein
MDDLNFGGGSPIRRAVGSGSGSVAFGVDVVGDLQAPVEKFAGEVSGAAAISCLQGEIRPAL